MFPYMELLNMDERDLGTWFLMARREHWIQERLAPNRKESWRQKCGLEIMALDKKLDSL